MVKHYNAHKHGVDLATEFLNSLKLYRRESRWTHRAFVGILGLSMFNILHICEQQLTTKVRNRKAFVAALGIALTQL